jgi:hypothetical protein
MGIEPLSQRNMQNAGLAGSDRLARNAMFPQSQMDKTQYAVSSQMPTSAEIIRSDYDTPSNAYTGLANQTFAQGGIASFAQGGSPFNDDPNNFAADLTKAYKATLGRDPSTEELRTNVDALNRNPDDYAFIVDQLVDDPSAAKFYAENAKPQVDEEGNSIAAPEYDPNQIATELKGAYGKYTPKPEVGGIQGFANKIGPYAPFLAAAAAIAGPALAAQFAGEAALSGAAVPLAEITGSTFAGPAFALPEVAAATIGAGGEAVSQGLTLKDAYKAYNYGKKGLGVLNALSGAGGTPTGSSSPYGSIGGGQNVSPGIANIAYNPNTYGNVGLGISGNYSPLQTDPLFLSKLSEFKADQPTEMAAGGIASLGSYSDGGHLLKGPGDGMSDHIPATIGNKQPARLAEGEFVIPADVVSHLGNGSTDAGAKQLYKMMDNIRRARTGNPKQGKQINPAKFTPKG